MRLLPSTLMHGARSKLQRLLTVAVVWAEVVCCFLQASHTELLAELKRLQAVQLGPYWRLVDTAYLGAVLEMLLVR